MSARELRASLSLASIFGLRLLGMFIILPVFALYAEHLPGWNLTLVGHRPGRLRAHAGDPADSLRLAVRPPRAASPSSTAGLLVFALGSFVCALRRIDPGS